MLKLRLHHSLLSSSEEYTCCYYCINCYTGKGFCYCNALNKKLKFKVCSKNRKCKQYKLKEFIPIEFDDSRATPVAQDFQLKFNFESGGAV